MGLTSAGGRNVTGRPAVSVEWIVYLPALSACGFTLGWCTRSPPSRPRPSCDPNGPGEAAGVTLTALVTLAGVGVAVSGTVLEML
ncbi:MAG: MFS transporter, partial [Mycobacterium sp.]